ncbi:MAG TPA: HAMP domain-containing sensor histidine kinase [Parvibaculum sp.]
MAFFPFVRTLRYADSVAVCAVEGRADAQIGRRVRVSQLEMLDRAVLSCTANVLTAAIVGVVIYEDVGWEAVACWIGALAVTATALVMRVRGHVRKGDAAPSAQNRLREHIVLATLIGVIWSAFCLSFGPMLSSWHMLVFSLTVVGCASGCIPALATYLPAFYGFFLTAVGPLIYVNFAYPTSGTTNVSFLLGLYAVAVALNARAYNRSIVSALRLRAKNEMLADSLAAAKAATSDAMKSKWESFAHLSHELRTPMNAVLGFSDMMRQQMFGQLSPRYLDYAGYIHESGGQALSLIDAILEVSRAKAGQLSLDETDIEPSRLVDECLQMIEPDARAKRLRLSFDSQPGLPLLFADRRKLRRLLLNLMANAVRYTDDGGGVSLTLRHGESGLDIIVADTGIGIAEDDIARCQEPFIRLGDPSISGVQGAGLGLPIARLLIEAHGGDLTIESALGQGTTVTVHFPPARCVAGTVEIPDMPLRRVARG